MPFPAEQAQRPLMQRQQRIHLQTQQTEIILQPSKIKNQMLGQILSTYDHFPLRPGDEPATSPELIALLSACRNEDLPRVQEIFDSQLHTPRFLSQALAIALCSGKVDAVRFFLKSGAPIHRGVPNLIMLRTPPDSRLPLFEALTEHGWTVNTPGDYGEVPLPKVICSKNGPLIDWFLAQGADPNLGRQKLFQDQLGEPDKDSCASLEAAARKGNVELVRKLLDAGAKMSNGAPLYCAAGVCPPGANPHYSKVEPSEEFDVARIPVMEFLVSRGAGVNDRIVSRYLVPPYPLEVAIMAGAVGRVKWLLEQGANPGLQGYYGKKIRDWPPQLVSDGMKAVLATMQEEPPVQAMDS